MAQIINIRNPSRNVTLTIPGTQINYMSGQKIKNYLANICKGCVNTWIKINIVYRCLYLFYYKHCGHFYIRLPLYLFILLSIIDSICPILYARRMEYSDNIWHAIVSHFKVRKRFELLNRCNEYSKNIKIDIRSIFLETIPIDDKSPLHKILFARACSETLSYGTMPLYRWFLFFLIISQGKHIELQYIAAIVERCENMFKSPPFITKRRNNSVLSEVCMFYNMHNIIECLLNVCELRFSLNSRFLTINGKKHDLYDICDELASVIPVSPKVLIKKIRPGLSQFIRRAGSLSNNPAILRHGNVDVTQARTTSEYIIEAVPIEIMEKFTKTKNAQECISKFYLFLEEMGMKKLLSLGKDYLYCTILYEKNTTIDDFIRAGSFFQNIMRVSGYGRSQKWASAPRSLPPRPDYNNIAQEIKKNTLSFHNKAIEAGITPTNDSDWVSRCISLWRSTSAGTKGIKIDVQFDGKTKQNIKATKKLAVGCVMGELNFRRTEMEKKLTKENPGTTGSRDVPYKASRCIYVIPMSTLNAMVAVSWHLVQYVSGTDKATPYAHHEPNRDHVASGSASMEGVRILDNLDTLVSSGSRDILSLDIDFDAYDSSNVYGNMRKPTMDALKEMDQGQKFGPDEISWTEMVDYAFGSGRVSNTYWDFTREPLLLVNDESREYIKKKYSCEEIRISEYVGDYKSSVGLKTLKPGSYLKCLDPIDREDSDHFFVGARKDGDDLVLLTSEASGELTTLCFNSIVNLSLQTGLIDRIKNSRMGSYVEPIIKKAVGDDLQIFSRVKSWNFTSDDIEDMIHVIQDYCDSCGFIISIKKTVFSPYSSEFVQTHATLGMYVPKDQIMLISSEKPRSISDPIGFTESTKRLHLSKISRGCDRTAATLIMLYLCRYIMRNDVRRYTVNIDVEQKYFSYRRSERMKDGRNVFINEMLEPLKVASVHLHENKIKKIYEKKDNTKDGDVSFEKEDENDLKV